MPRFSFRTKAVIIAIAVVSAATVGALVDRPAERSTASTAFADPEYLVFLTPPEALGERFAPRGPLSTRHVGFSVTLLTLSTPVELMKAKLAAALDKAEATGYPVLVQLDDWNVMFPSEDPEIVEWTAFPEEGQERGPVATSRWVERDGWVEVAPPPNYESDVFRAEVIRRLRAIGPVIDDRLNAWRKRGTEHLLAGVVCGWQSGIYTLPEGVSPDGGGAIRTGFAALSARGHTRESVHQMARASDRSDAAVVDDLLAEVVRDYTALFTYTLAECGLPRARIYTSYMPWHSLPPEQIPARLHGDGRIQPLWASANGYARPGLTLDEGSYDLDSLADSLAKMGHGAWGAVALDLPAHSVSADDTLGQITALYEKGASLACIGDPLSPLAGHESLAEPDTVDAVHQWLAD